MAKKNHNNGAKGKAHKAEPKITEYTEQLRHDFDQDEQNAMSKDLASAVKAKAIKEDEKTAIMSQYKAEIDGFQAKIALLSEKISAGFEQRPTKCRAVVDYEKDVKTITRLDTMEVVSSGKIPDEERQLEMSGAVAEPESRQAA